MGESKLVSARQPNILVSSNDPVRQVGSAPPPGVRPGQKMVVDQQASGAKLLGVKSPAELKRAAATASATIADDPRPQKGPHGPRINIRDQQLGRQLPSIVAEGNGDPRPVGAILRGSARGTNGQTTSPNTPAQGAPGTRGARDEKGGPAGSVAPRPAGRVGLGSGNAGQAGATGATNAPRAASSLGQQEILFLGSLVDRFLVTEYASTSPDQTEITAALATRAKLVAALEASGIKDVPAAPQPPVKTAPAPTPSAPAPAPSAPATKPVAAGPSVKKFDESDESDGKGK